MDIKGGALWRLLPLPKTILIHFKMIAMLTEQAKSVSKIMAATKALTKKLKQLRETILANRRIKTRDHKFK